MTKNLAAAALNSAFNRGYVTSLNFCLRLRLDVGGRKLTDTVSVFSVSTRSWT